MKKALLFTIFLFLLVLSAYAESQWFGILNDHLRKGFAPGSSSYVSWEKNTKATYGFELKEIVFNFILLKEEPCLEVKTQVHVFGILEINLLCIDPIGAKKSLYVKRMVVIEIESEEKVVLGGLVLYTGPVEVREGWDLKDVKFEGVRCADI